MALQRCDWVNTVFANVSVPPILRARAALEAGDPAQADALLVKDTSAAAAVVRRRPASSWAIRPAPWKCWDPGASN